MVQMVKSAAQLELNQFKEQEVLMLNKHKNSLIMNHKVRR